MTWEKIRLAIIRRDKVCQRCGTGDGRLVVHHKDKSGDQGANKNANNHPSNLITFCNSCHVKTHWEMTHTGQLYDHEIPIYKDI